MKILQLHIKGFRSLNDVLWKPGDLNVIIGKNGTGKSNLLRMLELISISAQGKLGKYVQSIGGMDALLWDGQASTIAFALTMSSSNESYYEPSLFDPPLPSLGLNPTYSATLARLGKGSSYRIEDEFFADFNFDFLSKNGLISNHIEKSVRHTVFTENSIFDLTSFRQSVQDEWLSEEETTLSLREHTPYSLTRQLRKHLMDWTLYHDINVGRDATIRQPIVARLERRVSADGQNLISVLHTLYTEDRNFKTMIDEAMRAAYGSAFDELVFPPASDQRIQLRVRWNSQSRATSAADLSDGTLRFLLLLTILAAPSPAPLIAIDEPETGLHPSMLPIVAEYAVDAATRTQIIMTTHSDQFLDAFGDHVPTTTVAKWEDGETSLTTLSGDELNYWLQDYSLGALYRSRELETMR